MPPERALILSCEHASNAVPARYAAHFRGAAEVLASHRGWDPGALTMARRFGRTVGAIVHAGRATRLLIDLNRSPHHRKLYSEYVRHLPAEEKARIVARYYRPYRDAIEAEIEQATAKARVLHISFHSFTPVLDGQRREVDFGLLYDPARASERRLADELARTLRAVAPELQLRRNQPYRGTDDGLIPYLRKRFPDARYTGIELELNQRFPLGDPARWRSLLRRLVTGIAAACSI